MPSTGPEVLSGRTKDLRGSLPFISFKKGHFSDIRLTTLPPCLKQTILLYYKQADQQSLDWVQVKVHDRTFAPFKAFHGGVLVDQIMQTSYWKAHIFTTFYLKDLPWSDSNNMYLGTVIAA